jgi:hypothetical protein
MSTRLGPANGQCITDYSGSRLMNDVLMLQNGIPYADNFSFRQYLQSAGPDKVLAQLPSKNSACDRPLGFPLDNGNSLPRNRGNIIKAWSDW